jgi:hypothetical protein
MPVRSKRHVVIVIVTVLRSETLTIELADGGGFVGLLAR